MIEVLGNPSLARVKADHYVWGISQLLGGSWRWNADIYYKNMKDVVISSEQDGAAENYSNGAEGKAYGLELVIRKDLAQRLERLGLLEPGRIGKDQHRHRRER